MRRLSLSKRSRGLGVVACGLLLLVLSAWDMQRAWALANGQEVKARVLSRDRERSTLELGYSDLKGTKHTLELRVSPERWRKQPPRSQVLLTYPKADPAAAVLPGESSGPVRVIFLLGVGVILCALGGMGVVRVDDTKL